MALMSNDHMPYWAMRQCVRDWQDMGVKAVELTGGGEPLVYPYVDDFLHLIAEWGADLALVTNGGALTEERADNFGKTNWKWARVSIDAGDAKTYMATRRVSEVQWDLAWRAVDRLVARRRAPDQRVGVGYVVDAQNYDGIYEACKLAFEHGADNIRVSLAFTPQNLSRFPVGAIGEAGKQAAQAKFDFIGRLQVNDLVSERAENMDSPTQNYCFCAVKEVLCVVGGDCNVYTCCSLAFNPKGLIGSIKEQSFKDLWWSKETQEFFRGHDASKICNIACLYEKRNLRALELMAYPPEVVEKIAADDVGLHRNFI